MAETRTGAPIEIWRGGVPPWECDEMQHLNVRFYVAHAMDGLMTLAAHLGLPRAFAANASSTLIVREHHIRFLKEARAGVALHMTGAVLDMGETDATLLQTLIHSGSGETCATIVTRVTHAAAQGARPFPWPQRTRPLAEAMATTLPADAGPRGLAGGPVTSVGSLAEANALGLTCISRGGLSAQDCDVFGRMRTELAITRCSRAMAVMSPPILQALRDALGPDRQIGGAALEYRLTYLGAPRAGDLYETRSGFAALTEKLMHMHHWLIDPVTGDVWAQVDALAGHFDIEARKVLAVPGPALKDLQRVITPGLPTKLG